MSKKIKWMSIKEFREKGYLQELNRAFLHPLGLALATSVDKETGEESLAGIWDFREGLEGLCFGFKDMSFEEVEDAIKKAKFIQKEWRKRSKAREKLFGSEIEPFE